MIYQVLEPSGLVYHAQTGILIGLAILNTLATLGTGIFKAARGRGIEKQAISDRGMYLNNIASWVEKRNKEHEKWKGYIEGGVPGWGGEGTIGKLTASSFKKGQEKISEQLSSYTDTLGKATSPLSEKDLMNKKFGLG